MTVAVIATQNADGTVTAILCHKGGQPDTLGHWLLEHYTRRSLTRALVRLGDRVDNVPHPYFLGNTDRGRPARRGPLEDVLRWGDQHNAQFIYLMGAKANWQWQRLGPTIHGVALRGLSRLSIAEFYRLENLLPGYVS